MEGIDSPEAVRWYRKAADQGHAEAQYFLGVMYDHAQGVTQDYAEAVRWYRKGEGKQRRIRDLGKPNRPGPSSGTSLPRS